MSSGSDGKLTEQLNLGQQGAGRTAETDYQVVEEDRNTSNTEDGRTRWQLLGVARTGSNGEIHVGSSVTCRFTEMRVSGWIGVEKCSARKPTQPDSDHRSEDGMDLGEVGVGAVNFLSRSFWNFHFLFWLFFFTLLEP